MPPSDSNESHKAGSAVDQKPEARSGCPVHPTTFGAFKQAVVDKGNAILCKTVRSPDSEKCRKTKVERSPPCGDADEKKRAHPGDDECRCGQLPAWDDKNKNKKKSTNSLNPTTPEKTLEFVKFFTDDGR